MEIETEEDGSLPLSSVEAHFPGTTTLKYKAKVSTGHYREKKAFWTLSAFEHIFRLYGFPKLSSPLTPSV